MKTSEAFKLARDRLWDGRGEDLPWNKHRYICVALDNVAPRGVSLHCQVIISRLLDPTGDGNPDTLEDWLIKQGHLGWEFYMSKSVWDYPDLRRKVQVTRRAWLNHLIKYYRSIGD
jgi:hypothetical protein